MCTQTCVFFTSDYAKKIQDRMLKWKRLVKRGSLRRKEGEGRRKRGWPKRRRLDRVRDGIKEKRLSADEVYDIVYRPHIKVGIR